MAAADSVVLDSRFRAKIDKNHFKATSLYYLCFVKNALLLFAALIVLAKPVWPVVDYVVNFDYIVNVLCENKDKPEMNCNGKCHLSKELAKEAGNDNKNPFRNQISNSEIPQVLIVENISEFCFQNEIDLSFPGEIGYRSNFHPLLFTSKILHPPQLG